MTCQTCQYWEKLDYGPKNHGECKNSMIQDSDSKEFREDGIVLGGDPYYSMFTGPQFGCIHYERKIIPEGY